jgi:hypothetical protein
MLVTFKCKGYSNITMFGDVAVQLLHLMQHSGTIPSALSVDDVPNSLSALRRAVNQTQYPSTISENNSTISLRQRAIPLLGLLEYACQEKLGVTWLPYITLS